MASEASVDRQNCRKPACRARKPALSRRSGRSAGPPTPWNAGPWPRWCRMRATPGRTARSRWRRSRPRSGSGAGPMPVLVDEQSNIIAGHGRVLAAQRLGLVEVPVMVARGWSEAQKQAYVIADNKLALNAGWDEDLLRIELGELQGPRRRPWADGLRRARTRRAVRRRQRRRARSGRGARAAGRSGQPARRPLDLR